MSSLVISEIFGPTVQGEGPAAGRRAVFVRLGGCNEECGWCDSKYTWDASRYNLRDELRRWDLGDVLAAVRQRGPGLVVLTGGEPLLQQGHGYGLADLAGILAAEGWEVHAETNGTIAPRDLLAAAVSLFVVSPKLAHSGMTASRTLRWDVLARFGELARDGKAILKVVCAEPADAAEAAAIGRHAGFPAGSVWVMPLGTSTADVVDGLRWLTDPAVGLGLNVTGRQHILTWGDERGR